MGTDTATKRHRYSDKRHRRDPIQRQKYPQTETVSKRHRYRDKDTYRPIQRQKYTATPQNTHRHAVIWGTVRVYVRWEGVKFAHRCLRSSNSFALCNGLSVVFIVDDEPVSLPTEFQIRVRCEDGRVDDVTLSLDSCLGDLHEILRDVLVLNQPGRLIWMEKIYNFFQ